MSQERREPSAMANAAQRSSEMMASSQSPVALAVAGSTLGVAMVRSAMVRRTEEQSRESPAGRGLTGNRGWPTVGWYQGRLSISWVPVTKLPLLPITQIECEDYRES